MTDIDPYQPRPGDTLLFENDRVRVWSLTLAPGEFGLWHSHKHDHVLIWPNSGLSRGQMWGDSETSGTQDAHDNYVMFKAVGDTGLAPHRLHNVDTKTTTHFIVELLGPSQFHEEQPYIDNGRGVSVDDEPGDTSGQPDTTGE
jgi:hypothetical protein